MRLFLIRHGETVDNVAGLYAGTRDSELTNHGFQQASRLGKFFADSGIVFTHIFSSDLQRASKTADLIRLAQKTRPQESDPADADQSGNVTHLDTVVAVQELALLRERDFGSLEGKPVTLRTPSSASDHAPTVQQKHALFVQPEGKESMMRRADTFWRNHLFPILEVCRERQAVAVISHGLLLSSLWRSLVRCLPAGCVKVAEELLASRESGSLENLGAWSNTGYLELLFSPRPKDSSMNPNGSSAKQTERDDSAFESTGKPTVVAAEVSAGAAPEAARVGDVEVRVEKSAQPAHVKESKLEGYEVTVKAVNDRTHLNGLKRTRGGVGSARHDAGQKSIDNFFKRQKTGQG